MEPVIVFAQIALVEDPCITTGANNELMFKYNNINSIRLYLVGLISQNQQRHKVQHQKHQKP